MADFASSKSKTTNQPITGGPAIASEGSAAFDYTAGNRSIIASTAPAFGAGLTLAKNAQLNIVTSDGGALNLAAGIVSDTFARTGGIVSDALSRISQLAETKVTDGANLNQKTTQLGLVSFAVVGIVLGGAFLLLKK